MLDTQAEQLNRVENNLDNINAEMKEADKALTGMEKWCGLFVCPWNRAPAACVDEGVWSSSTENTADRVVTRHQPGAGDDAGDGGGVGGVSGPYVQR